MYIRNHFYYQTILHISKRPVSSNVFQFSVRHCSKSETFVCYERYLGNVGATFCLLFLLIKGFEYELSLQILSVFLIFIFFFLWCFGFF